MNKLMLLTSASILAIGVATQANAAPVVQSTLADLCGTTVSVDTAVKGTVEVLTEATTDTDCTIALDGAKLEIKDAARVRPVRPAATATTTTHRRRNIPWQRRRWTTATMTSPSTSSPGSTRKIPTMRMS